MINHYPNMTLPEIDRAIVSMASMNSFINHVSSSRAAMFTGNLGQWLVVNGLTPSRIYEGSEMTYGQATFSQGFDRDVEIYRVIHRYPDAGKPGCPAKTNPTVLVIYLEVESGEMGCLELTEFHSTHQHFGFKWKRNEDVWDQLFQKSEIEAGTKVNQSPCVLPNGAYMYGLDVNAAFTSDVAGTEDGIRISQHIADNIIPRGYGTLSIEFGKNHFPTNQYGSFNDPDDYKMLPNVGEKINSDGLLMCLRRHDNITNVVNMNIHSICKPDYIFDRRKYAAADATIVDIQVERNRSINIPPMPVGTDKQLMWYWEADNNYYRKIIDVYYSRRFDEKGRERRNLKISEEFQQLLIRAIHRIGYFYRPDGMQREQVNQVNKDLQDVRSEYRGVPMDAWRITVVYETHTNPNVGLKMTDKHGGKGVIVRVTPTEDMPIDENGERVHIIMNDLSTTNRINPGRFYEQYLNASGAMITRRLRKWLGITEEERMKMDPVDIYEELVARFSDDEINKQYEYVFGFYEIVSPPMARKCEKLHAQVRRRAEHLAHLIDDGMYIMFPLSNPVHRPTMIRLLKKHYPAQKTKLTFRGYDGKMKTTKNNILVGSMYFLVLEKTAEDWNSVASAKLQVHGTPARLTKFDKDSAPGRQNVTKALGEAEVRSLAAYCGGIVVAELCDINNNPVAHKSQYRSVLTAEKPTDIEVSVDRNKIPKGGHRARQFLEHNMLCAGRRFAHELGPND